MPQPQDALRLSFDVAISLLLVFLIIAWCLQLLMPFIGLITWGTVIAISVHGPFCKLRNRMGNKLAAIIFALLGVACIVIPAWLFADSIVSPLRTFAENVEQGTFSLSPPGENVQNWPVIGPELYEAWASASTDMAAFLGQHSAQLKETARFALGKAAGMGLSILLFLGATLIAAALLANDKTIHKGMMLMFNRLVGPVKADEAMLLSTATVRSVTMGVLGVAFIQAVLAGIGMVAVGVPAAGIWTIVVLVLAIAQLPPWIVLVPIIFYVFSVEPSTTVASVFAIWSLIVSFADAFLKPLLLGRGVDVPTLVILLGAIGGMITSGLLGLFVGAVVLSIGYKLLLVWLGLDKPDTGEDELIKPDAS